MNVVGEDLSAKEFSVLTMIGIPTLIAGLVATVTVLVAGSAAGVLSDPRYWPAIVVAVPWIPIGIIAIWRGTRGTKKRAGNG